MKLAMGKQMDAFMLLIALFPSVTLFFSLMCVPIAGLAQYVVSALNVLCLVVVFCNSMYQIWNHTCSKMSACALCITLFFACSPLFSILGILSPLLF